jgi:uncharacterized protein HemX
MRTRTARETAIICAAIVVAIGIVAPVDNGKWVVAVAVAGVVGAGIALGYQYLAIKKQAQIELAGGEQYRQLAEQYRRLSDLAITAQEHTDLKLGEVSAQLDHLREQMASLQNILKDVE